MNRYFYSDSIPTFCQKDTNLILGELTRPNPFDLTDLQKNAWEEEIHILKDVFEKLKDTYPLENGELLFEFSIPRLGKRIDVVILLAGIVFILEFKVGEKEFLRRDLEQVWDYALDLKYFHEASHTPLLTPILVATEATACSHLADATLSEDSVYDPLCCGAKTLVDLLSEILEAHGIQNRDLREWKISRYLPTPTIIQAASSLYLHHSVEEITRNEASAKSLANTSNCVLDVIRHAKESNRKAIVFVTGVPGAGKTLVGLNVAGMDSQGTGQAVYLSGNKPLVDVISEALARDKKRQEEELHPGTRYNITDARRNVKLFIQIVHHYRNETLNKLKTPIRNQTLEFDQSKVKQHPDDGYAEIEHVAIFDEAQRAWTQTQLANWLKRKQGIDNFPMSEPEFLIWSLDLRRDWAVIVCLVGGGQEINTGEAGISEWLNALYHHFPQWEIYYSAQMAEKEYAGEKLPQLLEKNPHWECTDLHLATSMRSFRAEQLSKFIQLLLDGNATGACEVLAHIPEKYPIVLTRSLEAAKRWLLSKKRGSERYGMVVSSQAQRLRPLAIDVRCKPDTVHWFLDDISDIRSSLFLEDAASEFDVQGLELDWTCLVWDGDLRWEDTHWGHYSFTGNQWQTIRSEERKSYQLNAYRVLLTRARQGMVICVPEGNTEDATRKLEFYNKTYEYLKSLGIPTLQEK